jgi:hypothetical protein
MFLAGRVPDAHALALDDDPRIGAFEGLVLDQMVPEMRAVGLDDGAEIVGVDLVVHPCPPPPDGRQTRSLDDAERGPAIGPDRRDP